MIPILGMHRSGTSALAGALHKLGADLGPESSWIPPAADNPLGFFEYAPIVDVNREIIAAFGGTWSSPPPMPPGWIDDERVGAALERARSLAAEMPRGLVVKDPRLALVMPLWDAISTPRPAVICLRHPTAVASSLQRRNGFTLDVGLFLWFRYVAAAYLYRPEALTIQYERLLDDPAYTLRCVADHIEHECSDQTIEVAANTIENDLAHEEAIALPSSPVGELCAEMYDIVRNDRLGHAPEMLRWARLVTELPWAGPAPRELRHAERAAISLRTELDDSNQRLAAALERCERLESDIRRLTLTLDHEAFTATTSQLTKLQQT